MTLRGWASFAWQADYGQFYLIDATDASFLAPTDITDAVLDESFAIPRTGLVVYTGGCLQQRIDIMIHDAEPEHPATEPMSGQPWTRTRTATVQLPSEGFALSSPSHPDALPCGPLFLLDAPTVGVRINWKEFQGLRDDSVPVDPDVIAVTLWPV